MKERTLHVVSSACYRWTLKQAFYEMGIKEDVACLPIDFSLNYIPKDFSDTELMLSAMSLESLELQEKIVIFNQLKEFITKDYTHYEKVIVWHGWSAYDLLLLYLMSVLVGNNLYHIDITTCEDFMKKHSSLPYLDMGYVSPNDIFTFNMPSLAKRVLEKQKSEYANDWNRWKRSTAPYRFSNIHTGVIKEYPADFMDDTIIKYAREGYVLRVLMAKVFHEYNNLFISDWIILKRIRELYWEHIIEFTVSIREK